MPRERRPRGGTIVVSGTGRAYAEPDVADVRLGVALARPTVQRARADGAATMAAILDAIVATGVPRRDIRTSTLSVAPRYEYRDGAPPTLTGYELANVVEVTVRELGRLGDVVDGALGAGATSLDGLSFRIDDPAPIETEARRAAVEHARARATELADAAGVTIEGVADIVEGVPGPVPMPRSKAGRMALAADAATPIEAGTTEVAVTVTVTFRTR